MDIVVKGRRAEVTERFREHAVEKLSRVERLDSRIIRLDVEVSEERNPRQSDHRERVEVTCVSKGPLIRAEAAAADPYAALDLVLDKLRERLRRAQDRRRPHHGARARNGNGAAKTADALATDRAPAAADDALDPALADAATAPTGGTDGATGALDDTAGALDEMVPAAGTEESEGSELVWGAVVREKTFESPPMTLDEAVLHMELVGHDFFLFPDAETGLPSVVYRRRGYDYGVIRLRSSTQEVA